MEKTITIRRGDINDLDAIYDLVVDLAIYEREPSAVTATREDYRRDFEAGIFHTLIIQLDDDIIGMALYYHTYSTWKGRMLFLEDFIIKEAYRRKGLGGQLFTAFLEEAKRLDCVLTKWQVLDWNKPAIQFYEKVGAELEKNWWNGKIYMKS